MPAKDQARDNAFGAMKTARNDIERICRDIYDRNSPRDGQYIVDQLSALLKDWGFQVETGIAGFPTAFQASFARLDDDAMRKGLRHGHVAYLIPIESGDTAVTDESGPMGLAAVLTAVVGIAAALETEYGTVTVVGYPGDASLVPMADAGIFDGFDAVLGARPAADGNGYSYTIDGTGDTLATRTISVAIDNDPAQFNVLVSAVAATLEAPNQLETISSQDGVVELRLTGRTSVELLELSATVQQLADEVDDTAVSFGAIIHDTITNRILARRVKTYADTLGYKMDKIRKADPSTPTGWGNVSHFSPTFRFNFPTGNVAGAAEGTTEVSDANRYERTFQFGTCLCLGGLDVLRDMEFRSIADDQLVKALARRGINRQHRRWLGVHKVIKDPNEDQKKKSGPKMSDFQIVRGPGMRNN